MISDREPRGLGYSFNFSSAQWQTILDAVKDGCEHPSYFDAAGLLESVNRYLVVRSKYLSPSDTKKAWRRVAKLLEQTREALIRADPEFFLCSHARRDEKFGNDYIESAKRSTLYFFDSQKMHAEDVIRGRIRNDERSPRIRLLEGALDWWIYAGGRPVRSRGAPEASNARALGGPTLRFLKAVSSPVMGSDALTDEGLERTIRRYASRLESWLMEDDGEAEVMEAVQNGQDPVAARMAAIAASEALLATGLAPAAMAALEADSKRHRLPRAARIQRARRLTHGRRRAPLR
jgi:hypothetical protein